MERPMTTAKPKEQRCGEGHDAPYYRVVMDGPHVVAVLIPHGLSDIHHALAIAHLHLTIRESALEARAAKAWGYAEVIAKSWWITTYTQVCSKGGAMPHPRSTRLVID